MRRTAERVRAVLAELPGTQRQVLELAYYDGLSQREIAADLGTPLGTVKSLSRRALMALERALRISRALIEEHASTPIVGRRLARDGR